MSEDVLVSVSGWQPNGGGHPIFVFAKRIVQGGQNGVWFRINFVDDHANGATWLTFYQGGNPTWGLPEGTKIEFNAPPWH